MTLNDAHRAYLMKHAVDPELAVEAGVRSIETGNDLPEELAHLNGEATPGLLFPWCGLDGIEVPQVRPDKPKDDRNGRPRKYLFPGGAAIPANVHPGMRSRVLDPSLPLLVVEGTKQYLAAVSALVGQPFASVGLFGCWGWSKGGMPSESVSSIIWSGRKVVLAFDGDVASNPDVHQAANEFAAWVESWGGDVRWLSIPGAARKVGLDDWLATVEQDQRTARLTALIGKASATAPQLKAKQRPHPFFDGGGLRVVTLARDITDTTPMAVNAEGVVCVYQGGVYRSDPDAIIAPVVARLGDRFRNTHAENVASVIRADLMGRGQRLPERAALPMLNAANGMLDLRTLELMPHSPEYISWQQVPVEWDPEAECPVFDKWLAEVAGGQADDLLESTSLVLDPSVTPPKAAFLYGPSRPVDRNLVCHGNHS